MTSKPATASRAPPITVRRSDRPGERLTQRATMLPTTALATRYVSARSSPESASNING